MAQETGARNPRRFLFLNANLLLEDNVYLRDEIFRKTCDMIGKSTVLDNLKKMRGNGMMLSKRRGMLIIVSGLLMASIAGCGGSSTSVHPSTVLIAETTGNTWSYSLSGTATPTAGGAAQPVTGTAQISIISTNFNANPVQAIQIVSNVSINGAATVPVTQTIFFQQDGSNNIIELG